MSSGLEPASEPAAGNGQATEHAASWTHSGFMQLGDGSLDHLTSAEDRVELDLFDDGESLIAEDKALYSTSPHSQADAMCRRRCGP